MDYLAMLDELQADFEIVITLKRGWGSNVTLTATDKDGNSNSWEEDDIRGAISRAYFDLT